LASKTPIHTKILDLGFKAFMKDGYLEYQAEIDHCLYPKEHVTQDSLT